MTRAKFTPREWWIIEPRGAQDCDFFSATRSQREGATLVREVLPATECEADELARLVAQLEGAETKLERIYRASRSYGAELRCDDVSAKLTTAREIAQALLAKAKGRAE